MRNRPVSVIEGSRNDPFVPEPPVNEDIQEYSHKPQGHLYLPGEGIWIEDWQQVIRDEVAAIAVSAGLFQQPILPRCQGTDPTAEFHNRPPGNGWQVCPHHRLPLQCEQPAKQYEANERDVDEQD